jgi:peptide-methionine (R)-S-oxide reductase
MKIQKTDDEWQKDLTPQQYEILRKKGTEPAFTGEFVDNHKKGMYVCRACGNQLFDSKTKFESGSGWPSFYDVATHGNAILKDDNSFGLDRTEVVCADCGSHLGHIFDDGPKDKTGKRFCINSCALDFKPQSE